MFSDDIELTPPADCETPVVSEIADKMSVKLFPNPSTGLLRLEMMHVIPGKYRVDCLDITGKLLKTFYFEATEFRSKFIIDMTDYSEGLYLLKISGDNYNHCERVIIE